MLAITYFLHQMFLNANGILVNTKYESVTGSHFYFYRSDTQEGFDAGAGAQGHNGNSNVFQSGINYAQSFFRKRQLDAFYDRQTGQDFQSDAPPDCRTEFNQDGCVTANRRRFFGARYF